MVLIFVPYLNGYFRVYLIFRHAHMCIYNYIYIHILYMICMELAGERLGMKLMSISTFWDIVLVAF
jgi:uncharacterized SAM-binding protein YcdF (DUF218 family)